MSTLSIIILILISLCLISFAYVIFCWRSHRRPGRPLPAPDTIPAKTKRIVALGDSLTHATMSHNWLLDLQRQLGDEAALINLGTNGDLAWNALQKLDQVAAYRPDVVLIFIGGNDALASFSAAWADGFIRRKGLPQSPSAAWFEQNLDDIIVGLQQKTAATLVLMTPALFGENLESWENRQMEKYGAMIKSVSEKHHVPVLPIQQKMRAYVARQQAVHGPSADIPADHTSYRQRMRWSLIQHHFLLRSWDQISTKRGFYAVTDGVHLNAQAAGLITESVAASLKALANKSR